MWIHITQDQLLGTEVPTHLYTSVELLGEIQESRQWVQPRQGGATLSRVFQGVEIFSKQMQDRFLDYQETILQLPTLQPMNLQAL